MTLGKYSWTSLSSIKISSEYICPSQCILVHGTVWWHVSNLSPIMVSGWQYAISWKLSAAISNFVSSIPTSLIYNPVFCSNASSLLFPPWSESQRGHGQVSLLPVWRRLTLYAVISLFLFFFIKKILVWNKSCPSWVSFTSLFANISLYFVMIWFKRRLPTNLMHYAGMADQNLQLKSEIEDH